MVYKKMTAKETLLMEWMKYPDFRIFSETMPVILSAMELYARQEIIEYNNWKSSQGIMWNTINAATPSEHLYELYQQSKTKTEKK